MRQLSRLCSLALLFAAIPSLALADEPKTAAAPTTVNLETPSVLSPKSVFGQFDTRFFNRPESITYSSLTLRYGLFNHLEVGIRGTTGTTKDLAVPAGGTISHGGQDLEVFGKYSFMQSDKMGLAVIGGAGFPATPAQNRAIGTVGASGSFRALDRVTVFLNPRATLQEGNTIVGIGVGAEGRVSSRLSIVGDWTVIAAGENTRDTSDGSRMTRNIWGAALRWTTTTDSSAVSLDIGYGNGTGSTTGFGLTPGLGRSAAFYIALSARR